MCLYPRLIKNRKYIPNIKNEGKPPKIKDKRTEYVPVGCGKCMECTKKKARDWQIRLLEEIRTNNKNAKFVTLSYSNEQLIKLENKVHKKGEKTIKKLNKELNQNKKYKPINGYKLDNEIATISVRKFLENWRSKYGTSMKHWLVTELGQKNTERVHIHGILWTDKTNQEIDKKWKYGNTWFGEYVTEKTINYIVKYIHKTDSKHKGYTPKILTSPKIGSNYIYRDDCDNNNYAGKNTNELYITRDRIKLPLPIYYRNKIYTEEEREELWLNLLDKETRYINGIKVDVSKSENDYNKLLKTHRIINDQLGYGKPLTYKEKEYERNRRNLKKLQNLRKINPK